MRRLNTTSVGFDMGAKALKDIGHHYGQREVKSGVGLMEDRYFHSGFPEGRNIMHAWVMSQCSYVRSPSPPQLNINR
jgi:hypothetical protein